MVLNMETRVDFSTLKNPLAVRGPSSLILLITLYISTLVVSDAIVYRSLKQFIPLFFSEIFC